MIPRNRRFGWPGRFADVASIAVNFYSTGDEVLELAADNDLNVLTGVTDSLAHHARHKPDLFKGRGFIDCIGISCGRQREALPFAIPFSRLKS